MASTDIRLTKEQVRLAKQAACKEISRSCKTGHMSVLSLNQKRVDRQAGMIANIARNHFAPLSTPPGHWGFFLSIFETEIIR